MSDDVSAMVKLIQNLSTNSQDDTDPNNVVLNKYQSPTELNQLNDAVKVTKWVAPWKWAAGSQAGFARTTIATNSADGSLVIPNTPRFVPTPFGKGILTEEPTTNWVVNSDFMNVASLTGVYFSDALTDNQGGPWTNPIGTFTYGVNGATSPNCWSR